MLEKLENISHLIRHPLCAPASEVKASQRVGDFPHVNGIPVLVDFSASILNEDDVLIGGAESLIDRSKNSVLKSFAKRILHPPQKRTVINIDRFMREVRALNPSPLVLVIGGGTIGQGMSDIYEAEDIRIIAFDIYSSPHIHFIADAHNIPLLNESVDAVVIQAVLEHVLDPIQVVSEIWRVLKIRGLVYSETPFLQHVHEGPYDFTRFTESGHRYLFKNFSLIGSGSLDGAGTQLIWSIDYFARSIFRSRIAGKIFRIFFIWLRFFDGNRKNRYSLDAASGVYFIGRKSDIEMNPKQIVEFYLDPRA